MLLNFKLLQSLVYNLFNIQKRATFNFKKSEVLKQFNLNTEMYIYLKISVP